MAYRTKFRNRFLSPFIAIKVVSMTNPDKPQSPNQRYYLTQKGRAFLAKLRDI